MHTHCGILFSHKKWDYVISRKMERTRKYYTKEVAQAQKDKRLLSCSLSYVSSRLEAFTLYACLGVHAEAR